MLPYPEPESWLDVGTGHGHFPAVAKEIHPYTAFDGLDPTRRVEKARAAGRVEEAHRGRLTDPAIAERLRARYDVVSMFHHLEHTPDPREELRAALTVLRPGGHLLVEVPDPDCAFGALLGKWWVSYGQPRHLHLMPLPNLLDELDSLGCEIVSTDRREPHIPYDLTGALALALGRVLPGLDAPWRPTPPTALQRTPPYGPDPGVRPAAGLGRRPGPHARPAPPPHPLLERVPDHRPRRRAHEPALSPAACSACPATTSSTCSHSAANAAFRRPSSSR